MSYKNYINSKKWDEMKIELIIERGQTCECCNEPVIEAKRMRLVHLTTERLYNEEPADVMLMCVRCSQIQRNKLSVEWHKKHPEYAWKKGKGKKPKTNAERYPMSKRDKALQKRYDALKK